MRSWRGCPRLRWAVLAAGTALDCARTVTAGAVAAGFLFGAERTAADGATELQLAVSLVCGLGDRRPGMESRRLQQEPRSVVEPGLGTDVLRPCESAGDRADVGRALHRGWDADRGLGWAEELSPQGRHRPVAAEEIFTASCAATKPTPRALIPRPGSIRSLPVRKPS